MQEEPSVRFSPTDLLRALTEHGVDFVVIGGVALVAHGSARVTFDLDVAFARDPGNLRALGAVLTGLDAKLRGVDEELPFVADEGTLDRVQLLTLKTSAGPIDVHVRPAGAPAYETLRMRATRVDVGGFAVLVASIDDLIAMKKAAGRPKDLIDVEELEEIRRQQRRRDG